MEIKKTVISDSHFSRCKYIKYSEKKHKIPFFFFFEGFEPWICWGEYIPFLRPVTGFRRTKIGAQILIDQLKINIDTV